jgi:Holliday junction resolvase-like predicted endonuclease
VLGAGVIVGRDELDLVAVEPGAPATLVFVEVRSHRTDRFGPPEATVDEPKLRRVYRAGLALAAAGVLPDGRSLPAGPWRVDLVAVDLHPAIGRAAGGPTMRHLRSVIPR